MKTFYASTTASRVETLSSIVGARVVHYHNNEGRVYFEPRINTAYKISEQINLKAGYGRSNQFITQQFDYSERGAMSGQSENYWTLAAPGDVRYPVITADHVTAGATL